MSEFDGRCVRCKWQQVESNSAFCSDCAVVSRSGPSKADLGAGAANPNQNLGCLGIGVGLFLVLGIIGQCTGAGESLPSDQVNSQDRRAYEELRDQGYSKDEARNAAPAIRRLCEAGGGSDCS